MMVLIYICNRVVSLQIEKSFALLSMECFVENNILKEFSTQSKVKYIFQYIGTPSYFYAYCIL